MLLMTNARAITVFVIFCICLVHLYLLRDSNAPTPQLQYAPPPAAAALHLPLTYRSGLDRRHTGLSDNKISITDNVEPTSSSENNSSSQSPGSQSNEARKDNVQNIAGQNTRPWTGQLDSQWINRQQPDGLQSPQMKDLEEMDQYRQFNSHQMSADYSFLENLNNVETTSSSDSNEARKDNVQNIAGQNTRTWAGQLDSQWINRQLDGLQSLQSPGDEDGDFSTTSVLWMKDLEEMDKYRQFNSYQISADYSFLENLNAIGVGLEEEQKQKKPDYSFIKRLNVFVQDLTDIDKQVKESSKTQQRRPVDMVEGQAKINRTVAAKPNKKNISADYSFLENLNAIGVGLEEEQNVETNYSFIKRLNVLANLSTYARA
ncbi:uncharacterized protein [Amphiura filiformis]|uniref:uncharacterized protein n=1 Tax=Amphiura filiformis TaxID=82378 RepID=UPI003B20D207